MNQQQKQSKVKQLRQQARRHLDDERYEEAIPFLVLAKKITPQRLVREELDDEIAHVIYMNNQRETEREYWNDIARECNSR